MSHKYFIDALTEAFETLGGTAWMSNQNAEKQSTHAENVADVIFANTFASLHLEGLEDGADVDESSDEEGHQASLPAAPAQRHQQKKYSGKGKKNKRSKKAKKKEKQKQPPVEEPRLEDVPLESYRIIEDNDGLVTDYLLAVYSLFQEWVGLRAYVQRFWREVAYDGLNSATAGTLSNIAVSMIRRTEKAIFVEFPGHDSYETALKTITRGNLERAQRQFGLSMNVRRPGSDRYEEVQKTYLDVNEHFSIHTYQDLLDFILGFQMTRSGKPTTRMLAEIKIWDPHFNLQKVNKEARIKWRRSYTINWLYDLVNVFSSIVVQRNTIKGEHHIYEEVDWSVHGPWNEHRRLFGLNEFAGLITSLAMQKPGADVRSRILPNHVFQLQCIIDSLAVSCGWPCDGLQGHVLRPVPIGYRPRRDVDLFLDRTNERTGHGYLQAVPILKQLFEKDAMIHGEPDRHQAMYELLELVQGDFINWLGETMYMYGLQAIPPSQFSNSNPNGLWEYSPFLCGVGLMEALELAYRITMKMWDRIPEPMLLIHLQNMLVQKGYITEPIGLYSSFESLMASTFFADGKPPTSAFDLALVARLEENRSRATKLRQQAGRQRAQVANDVHGLLGLEASMFFRTKSNLLLYREADWNPERIPDVDISFSPMSSLATIRIVQTKQTVDPVTGKRRLTRTDLVDRAIARGISENDLLKLSRKLSSIGAREADEQMHAQAASLAPGYNASIPWSGARGTGASTHRTVDDIGGHVTFDPTGRDLLELLKWDIHRDVSGSVRLSGVNYLWVTIRFLMLVMQIEDELERTRNPLWIRAYETGDREMGRNKRVNLTVLALNTEDDECLRVMAEQFRRPRAGFLNHIYWEDVDEEDRMLKRDGEEDGRMPECTIM